MTALALGRRPPRDRSRTRDSTRSRPLRRLLSRSVPNGGDWSTVNVGPVSADQPYEQRSVAGYREIIDLSPANDSRFIIDVGQSGHVLSRTTMTSWRTGATVRHRKMRMERAEFEKNALGKLELRTEN